ncbi:MAG: rRNA maturation RNase YbeY [Bacilli bacterium]|nr:rRNA maturation RNase YbeY [Bacilli bacterium]
MITITNLTNENIDELKTLEKLSKYLPKYLKEKNVSYDVIIVDEEKIQELNKNYRGKDSVTDVISFALEDNETIEMPERCLGEIYICLKRAKDQANEYGHSLKRELCFLLTHGFLHLNGYDHMTPEDEKVMFSLQDEILNSFGVTRED